VATDLIKQIREKAIGMEVTEGVTAPQQFVKIMEVWLCLYRFVLATNDETGQLFDEFVPGNPKRQPETSWSSLLRQRWGSDPVHFLERRAPVDHLIDLSASAPPKKNPNLQA
jgi:hypothetical protein